VKNVVFSATVKHFLFPVTLGNLSSASPNINKHPDNIDNMASSQPRRSALLPISNSNSNASKPRVDSTNPKALVLEPTSTTPPKKSLGESRKQTILPPTVQRTPQTTISSRIKEIKDNLKTERTPAQELESAQGVEKNRDGQTTSDTTWEWPILTTEQIVEHLYRHTFPYQEYLGPFGMLRYFPTLSCRSPASANLPPTARKRRNTDTMSFRRISPTRTALGQFARPERIKYFRMTRSYNLKCKSVGKSLVNCYEDRMREMPRGRMFGYVYLPTLIPITLFTLLRSAG
jgi:hypothetical protein